MIIYSSKVKAEAILLFCRDLIDSYESNTTNTFELSDELKEFIDSKTQQLYSVLNKTVQPIDYYIRNSKVSRISLIVKSYQFIEKQISKKISQGTIFNPFILCFSLLSIWFAELGINRNDKEFIYFSIYPYSEIFDTMMINNSNIEYKNINLKMLNIAEDTILKLNKYKFK